MTHSQFFVIVAALCTLGIILIIAMCIATAHSINHPIDRLAARLHAQAEQIRKDTHHERR